MEKTAWYCILHYSILGLLFCMLMSESGMYNAGPMADIVDSSFVTSHAQWKSVMKNILALKKIITFLTIYFLTVFIIMNFYRSDNMELKPYMISDPVLYRMKLH